MTAGRAGKCSSACFTATGPACPPAICSRRAVARSIARSWCEGSTPALEALAGSVVDPQRLPRPITASGAKSAASKKMSVVSAVTEMRSPPMMPAMPIGPAPSVIKSTSGCTATVLPSSSVDLFALATQAGVYIAVQLREIVAVHRLTELEHLHSW